ncbi:MAG: DUF695 domain-containing protein [Bacteroidales bacterium]|nr:DUF695 domain-containing protein [Candidatus Physcocola equi]
MKGNWFVAELTDGSKLRGRMGLEEHAQSGLYPYRIDVVWKKSDSDFDEDMTAKMEEQLLLILEEQRDAFLALVKDAEKEMTFSWYARNLGDFEKKLNQVLMFFPPLPISVFSSDDDEWLSYYSALKVLNNFY